MNLKVGDRVSYVGPPIGSGVPEIGAPDLIPGDEGRIVDVAQDGAVVVQWRDAITLVHTSTEGLARC